MAFNASDEAATLTLRVAAGRYHAAYPRGDTMEAEGGSLTLELAPRSAQVWIR